MSDFTEETVTYDGPEDMYPPVPGGMVDTARKQMAKDQAQLDKVNAAPSPVPAFNPVTVKIRQPDDWGARTITIGAGYSVQAMPADRDRKRGVINLITTDSGTEIIIARDRSAADTGTGYLMLASQPPLEFGHGREVWINNPGTDPVQVSVFSESYSRE